MKKIRNLPFADIVFGLISFSAAFTVLTLIFSTILVLYNESSLAIHKFGLLNFIFTVDWDPVREIFGAAASLYGTLVTTILALSIAIPVSIGIAIFLTEISPHLLKTPIGIAIEMLAAIPSIIYGMWGLFTLAPIMAEYIEPALQSAFGDIPVIGKLFEGTPMGVDLLTASIILSIMITPFIASISRDSFNLTPDLVKESAYALGATKWEVIKDIVIPYSKLGVYGGIVLALGRALGETMAVAFVLGNKHQITPSLLDAAATITVTLANEFTEADSDIYLSSLFYLALILFLLSFTVLAIAKYFLLKAEKHYQR
ncbi:phosphate transport system permease protein [Persephonella hydrogeniphila]|uniref:Phosphate transport system permease protein n=1 Tax=Persephonella hydrogeniphila TaxID=198703 RepID=A0A285N263_9AQUI|nr:phosphate ABC transporter permease subunit PstC [Persephonella hydrogeniphila]SNZ03565.1 phosphate transport system permease protein [Persephonella hydrogeniphila]